MSSRHNDEDPPTIDSRRVPSNSSQSSQRRIPRPRSPRHGILYRFLARGDSTRRASLEELHVHLDEIVDEVLAGLEVEEIARLLLTCTPEARHAILDT